jgi:hypothetical protein
VIVVLLEIIFSDLIGSYVGRKDCAIGLGRKEAVCPCA